MSSSPPAPSALAPFDFARFLWWLLLSTVAAAALAWLSLQMQAANLSPLVLFSLVLGGASGGVWLLLARKTGVGHRPALIGATVALALVLAALQHFFAYLHYLQSFRASVENNPKAAIARTLNPEFGPAGFADFLTAASRQRGRIWMWTVDAVLIVAAAVVVVILGTRRPYCSQCRQWYHKQRAGMLAAPSLAVIRTMASGMPKNVALAKFRLLGCLQGCRDSLLEVMWHDATGTLGRETLWLSSSERGKLEASLSGDATDAPPADTTQVQDD